MKHSHVCVHTISIEDGDTDGSDTNHDIVWATQAQTQHLISLQTQAISQGNEADTWFTIRGCDRHLLSNEIEI